MMKELTEAEAETFVLELLTEKGKMTTRAVDEETQHRALVCPEGTLRTLNKLRVKGVIRGAVSREHHGWIWWVDLDDENSTSESSAGTNTASTTASTTDTDPTPG